MDINFKEGMKPEGKLMSVWIYNNWKAGMYQPVTVKQKTKKKLLQRSRIQSSESVLAVVRGFDN